MTQTWDFRDCGGNARVRIQYNFPSFFVQADFHLLVWYPGRNDLMRHLSSLTTRKPQDGMNTSSPRQRTIFLRTKNSFDPNICTHASQKDWNRYCSRRLHLLLDMVPALLSLSHSQLLHTTSPSPSTSQQHRRPVPISPQPAKHPPKCQHQRPRRLERPTPRPLTSRTSTACFPCASSPSSSCSPWWFLGQGSLDTASLVGTGPRFDR